MDTQTQNFEDLTNPVLSFGVVLRARMGKIKEIAEGLASDPDVKIVISKVGQARTLWLEEREHPDDEARRHAP